MSEVAEEPKPTLRWFVPTPGKFVAGLLVVELGLLMVDRFSLFGFRQGHWRNVLLSLAIPCVGVVIGLAWLGASLYLRRRFQFGIKTLLLLIIAVAIPCAWFRHRRNRAGVQEGAVRALTELDFGVVYEYNSDYWHGIAPLGDPEPPGPDWLRDRLGLDFFAEVYGISCPPGCRPENLIHVTKLRRVAALDLTSAGFALRDCEHLENINGLRSIRLPESSSDDDLQVVGKLTGLVYLHLASRPITDRGMRHLASLVNLKELDLCYTAITDEGLKHLAGMTELEWLHLDRTNVSGTAFADLQGLRKLTRLSLYETPFTDQGLSHLSRLSNLEDLFVNSTNVTDAGLVHVKNLTNLQQLFADSCRISGEGLQHLKGLPNLEQLRLNDTQVADDTLVHLNQLPGLRDLWLNRTNVTDAGIQHLGTLGNLEFITVMDTRVSKEGAAELQRALPNCRIQSGSFFEKGDGKKRSDPEHSAEPADEPDRKPPA